MVTAFTYAALEENSYIHCRDIVPDIVDETTLLFTFGNGTTVATKLTDFKTIEKGITDIRREFNKHLNRNGKTEYPRFKGDDSLYHIKSALRIRISKLREDIKGFIDNNDVCKCTMELIDTLERGTSILYARLRNNGEPLTPNDGLKESVETHKNAPTRCVKLSSVHVTDTKRVASLHVMDNSDFDCVPGITSGPSKSSATTTFVPVLDDDLSWL